MTPQKTRLSREVIESNRKKQLASLLTTYSLSNTINFATRIQNISNTAIDNIFIDNSRINLPSISPIINGLSYHFAQILKIKNIYATTNVYPWKQQTRLIDSETITNLPTLLKKATWKFVCIDTDPKHMFNSCLSTFKIYSKPVFQLYLKV